MRGLIAEHIRVIDGRSDARFSDEVETWGRWIVECTKHGQHVNETSERQARWTAQYPHAVCDACDARVAALSEEERP